MNIKISQPITANSVKYYSNFKSKNQMLLSLSKCVKTALFYNNAKHGIFLKVRENY